MKRKIFLSIALVLTIGLLALTGSDSTARAQRNKFYRYDSGMVTLGMNQKLVITVSNITLNGDVVFQKTEYDAGVCNGAICKHSMISETNSNPVSLAIGEGASDTVAFSSSVTGTRVAVISKDQNLTVTAQIKDAVSDAIHSGYVVQSGPNAGL